MGRQPAGLTAPPTFALVGHQDSWDQISRIVHTLRTPEKPVLSPETIREIMPWIPPRRIAQLAMRSLPDGAIANGAYVETFITPDELGSGSLRQSIGKVRDGIRCAAREGARIAALGGFTSILFEGRETRVHSDPDLVLTTGNTLTAAFVAKGLERAAKQVGVPLTETTLLIVGATGDIGTGCARYFAGRAGRLLLSARRPDRLALLASELRTAGAEVEIRSVHDALPRADAVIGVASLAQPEWELADCRPDAIVCDAGYPKNLRSSPDRPARAHVFHGGMGRIRGGWTTDSPLVDALYSFPKPFIIHGCMLEAIVLAMAGRYEPFSQGRGRITPARMEEIWSLAAGHGVELAPLYNHDGLWPAHAPARVA